MLLRSDADRSPKNYEMSFRNGSTTIESTLGFSDLLCWTTCVSTTSRDLSLESSALEKVTAQVEADEKHEQQKESESARGLRGFGGRGLSWVPQPPSSDTIPQGSL